MCKYKIVNLLIITPNYNNGYKVCSCTFNSIKLLSNGTHKFSDNVIMSMTNQCSVHRTNLYIFMYCHAHIVHCIYLRIEKITFDKNDNYGASSKVIVACFAKELTFLNIFK